MKHKLSYILIAALSLIGAAACQKEFEIFDELAVSSHTLNIAQTPGETHIAVYSTGAWEVALDSNVDWAGLNKLSGEGLGDFVLCWSANYGAARSIDILVTRGSLSERIHVIQAGAITSPYITLGKSKVVLPRQKTDYIVSMTTNLGFSVENFRAKAIYRNEKVPADTVELAGTPSKGWISACRILDDHIEFSIEDNSSGEDRGADLVCYTTDASGVETHAILSLVQSASGPVFKLSEEAGDYFANARSCTIPAEENNIWSLEDVEVSSGADWIVDMAILEEGLHFATSENTSGSSRSADVTVTWKSAGGTAASAVYKVRQTAEKLLSFQELRAKVPGTLHGKDLIEGFIVSDPTSPNVCSSPQTGQFDFDRTENGRTAYIESTDASYGLCLKFTDASENTVPRWSKVRVSLDGLTLERQTNPMRFTLRGLTSDKITITDDGTPLPEKTRTIAQLSDADIFTYTSLQRVEIMCKDGCYTNASEGYCLQDELNPLGATAPRWDAAPLLCSDENGDVIYMLTNAASPWRRTGRDVSWYSCLPQGAGTLGGVVVYDEVVPVRWGNLGKYQIRPMGGEDIDLEGPGFSNTICEWNWNDSVEKLTPDEGKGTLNKYDAATKFVQDYNNPYLPTEDTPNGNGTVNLKGLVAGGAICLTQKWWDSELNEGKYFDVEFSTAGLSGSNLVFGIVWGHGLGSSSTVNGPSHWNVLYSTDGVTFSPVSSDPVIKQRSCAWWSSPQTSQDCTPGYTEHLVKLPASCFGKSKVTVRLQVADTVSDIAPSTSASTWRQALGIEKGFLGTTGDGPVRIGTITVRFN
ncbi:MAG: BACON domain-containing protein [Bacteroidales bacterium]|nr:BACON domain-containing protein [Bacteroidales bacterium]